MTAPLVPFSKPRRPWNDNTGPDEVRGALNQIVKALSPGGSITVSTGTLIAPAPSGQAIAFVVGTGGGGTFCDIVAWNPAGSAVALASGTTSGSPATRTYSVSGGALVLTMSTGTYTVQVITELFS